MGTKGTAEGATEAAQAAKREGTRWSEDPTGQLSAGTSLLAQGGWHTVADEDGAVYDVLTDAKVGGVHVII